MTLPNTRLERYKLFLNDPLIRKGLHSSPSVPVQTALNHIMRPEKTRADLPPSSLSKRLDSTATAREFENMLNNIEDLHNMISSLENATGSLRRMLEQKINGLEPDERKMQSLIQALDLCHQDAGVFCNKIGSIRDSLAGNVYKGDEDNRRLGGFRDSNRTLFQVAESPIKINSSLILEHNEPMKSDYSKMKELQVENEKLQGEMRALLERIDFYNQQRETHYAQVQSLQNENRDLKEKLESQGLIVKGLEVENNTLNRRLRQSGLDGQKEPLLKLYEVKSEQKEMAQYAEKKKLIEKNEALIMQMSELRLEKVRTENLLKLKTSEADKLPEMENKVKKLEAELTKKNEGIMTLGQQLKLEKVKNYDLMERFKALETAYKHSLYNPPQSVVENEEGRDKQIFQKQLTSTENIALSDLQIGPDGENQEGSANQTTASMVAARIALQGTLQTILNNTLSPQKKEKTKDKIKKNAEKSEKEKSMIKDAENKSQTLAASPQSSKYNGDYEKMKQEHQAEKTKAAQIKAEIQRQLTRK